MKNVILIITILTGIYSSGLAQSLYYSNRAVLHLQGEFNEKPLDLHSIMKPHT